MNKLLIVYLAVCIISIHAYVKRDAPAQTTEKNYLEDIQNQLNQILSDVRTTYTKVVNPDTIKKSLNEFIDQTNNLLKKPTEKKE